MPEDTGTRDLRLLLALPFVLIFELFMLPFRSIADRKRGWKVGRKGRDDLYYAEYRDGEWERIIIPGEMMSSDEPGHIVYLESTGDWSRYPSWAMNRKEEIITRIKERFPSPYYEYE